MGSPFYERKRRLAYVFAALSLLLLAANLYLQFRLETYGRPRISADAESVAVVHGATSAGQAEPGSRLLQLDPALRIRRQTPLVGRAAAALPEGEEVLVLLGARYAVLREGDTVRGADLHQKWEVQDAVLDPGSGQAWLFGWTDGQIVARRRALGSFSQEIPVAKCGSVERLSASADRGRGPLVAWREAGSTRVKAALWNGREFAPRAEFDVGAAPHWDVVLAEGRVLLLYYLLGDREFGSLALRLKCCADCGRPPPPEKAAFGDPVLVLGPAVTGLSAAASGDRLLLVLTRVTTIQSGSLPLDTLRPEPGARLAPLGSEPLWRRLAGAAWPLLLLFFSFSLVFLGFMLLRERRQFILEMFQPPAREGPPHAAILQRAMAHILDQMVLFLPVWVAAEVLNVAPETTELDLGDPKVWALAGVWAGVHFLYHFLMEGLLGWTLGKKVIGLRVAQADGSPLTWTGALVRNLLRPIDAEYPLGVFLGTAVLALTPRRQRLGDLAARTLVLEDRPR